MPPPSPEHAWADMQERCRLPYLNKKKSWSKFRGSGWHYTLCISRCMPDTCRRPGAVARGCHAVKRVQNGLPSATSSCDTCTPVHPAQTPGRMFLPSFKRKNVPRTRMSGTLRAQGTNRGVTCWATWSDKYCWTCLRRSLTRTLRVSFDESAMGVLSRSSLTEVSKGAVRPNWECRALLAVAHDKRRRENPVPKTFTTKRTLHCIYATLCTPSRDV